MTGASSMTGGQIYQGKKSQGIEKRGPLALSDIRKKDFSSQRKTFAYANIQLKTFGFHFSVHDL